MAEALPPTPIFICCCPRSGSTLLARVLNGLTGCIALPEGRFVTQLACLLGEERMSDGEIERVRSFILNHWQFRAWQIPLTLQRGVFDDSTLGGFMGNFIDEFARARGRADEFHSHFIDQFPDNILFASDLLRHFPAAKFIHLIRDGRAVAASVKHLDWGPNTALKAAVWWKRYGSAGAAMEAQVPPGNLYRLKFEDLVSDEAGELQALARFLGLPGPSRERNRSIPVPGYARDQHSLVNKPLDQSRIDGWRRQLSRQEICTFESIAGGSLQRLGYALDFPGAARPPGGIQRFATLAYDNIKGWRNAVLYRHRRGIGAFQRLDR